MDGSSARSPRHRSPAGSSTSPSPAAADLRRQSAAPRAAARSRAPQEPDALGGQVRVAVEAGPRKCALHGGEPIAADRPFVDLDQHLADAIQLEELAEVELSALDV